MFLDSGGFSFFSKYSDYPFSLDDFLELVQHPYYGYWPLLWAPLDYPCEPAVQRDNLISNADRIEATIDNLAYLSRKATHPGLVPVVQGYTLGERLRCCEEIFRRGLNRSLMAVGSLCALPNVSTITEIVKGLSWAFPGQRWHLFGVKLSYFSKLGRVPQSVFSFDTAAWSIGSERKNPRYDEQAGRFFAYRSKVEVLFAGRHNLIKPTLNCVGQEGA
jgi:hypothetical protein